MSRIRKRIGLLILSLPLIGSLPGVATIAELLIRERAVGAANEEEELGI